MKRKTRLTLSVLGSMVLSTAILWSIVHPVQNVQVVPTPNPCVGNLIQVFGTSPANGTYQGSTLTTVKGCNFIPPDGQGQHTWVYFGQKGGCTPLKPNAPPTVGPTCLMSSQVQFVDPSTLVVLTPSIVGSKIPAQTAVDITVYVKPPQ